MPFKLLKTTDSFWLFLIFSVVVHALAWAFVPNPLKQSQQSEQSTDIEVVGTVPTVNLPQKKNPPSKLTQIANQNLPSPQNENRVNTKSAIIDLPENSPEKNQKEAKKSDLPEKVKPDPKPTEPAKSAEKVAKKTEPKTEPSSEQLDDFANKKSAPTENTSGKKLESQNTNDKSSEPTAKQQPTEPPTAGATLSQDQFRLQFGKIYAEYAIKYGKENVVQRIIPSPNQTTVSQVSQSIEPGINWIPPIEQPKSDLKGQNTKVTVTLIVAPDGKVEKKWMFSSKDSNVDEIVKKTVKGYESKFAPLEGKIRIVTISYDFPG